jgi:hypothetical protein
MRIRFIGSLICGLLIAATTATAQERPPIDGITGTIALGGTMKKTYDGLNTVVVETMDGFEHLFHLAERTVVHGGKSSGEDLLRGIDEGSTVVVHDTVQGGEEIAHEVDRVGEDGLKTSEGIVTKVDRGTKTISIRLADGSEQTLRLTERAAADAGKDIDAAVGSTKVIVDFSGENGHRVARYFERIA